MKQVKDFTDNFNKRQLAYMQWQQYHQAIDTLNILHSSIVGIEGDCDQALWAMNKIEEAIEVLRNKDLKKYFDFTDEEE